MKCTNCHIGYFVKGYLDNLNCNHCGTTLKLDNGKINYCGIFPFPSQDTVIRFYDNKTDIDCAIRGNFNLSQSYIHRIDINDLGDSCRKIYDKIFALMVFS